MTWRAIIVIGEATQEGKFNFLDKAQLVRLRLRAMRRGVWFRALPRIDRVLIDLTIKIGTGVHSYKLAKSILSVVRKLEEVLESKLVRAIREIGVPLACQLSLFAQKWGHQSAREWANDTRFARYLTVLKLNG
jgi:hypothetical protein